MARRPAHRPTKLTDHVIITMEGRTSEIRERTRQRGEADANASDSDEDYAPPTAGLGRPVSDTLTFVADVAACARSSVEKWVARGRIELAREMRGRKLDVHDRVFARFADAFDALRRASAQQVAQPLVETAMQTADKTSQIAAAKIVLPRIDPSGWGPQGLKVELNIEPPTSVAIEKLPQEVIDALTEQQLEQFDALERALVDAQSAVDEFVASLG